MLWLRNSIRATLLTCRPLSLRKSLAALAMADKEGGKRAAARRAVDELVQVGCMQLAS